MASFQMKMGTVGSRMNFLIRASRLGMSRRLFASVFEHCKGSLAASGHAYYALDKLKDDRVKSLPFCLRILLEAQVRNCDDVAVPKKDVEAILSFPATAGKADINWKPPRVILQDLSGIPALMDLCAMRDALASQGKDPQQVNPLSPVDLVVDHSVIVDVHGRPDALQRNMQIEFSRNKERFEFLKWAEGSFENFNLVPPGSGIVHQVHCESLARIIMVQDGVAFPDGVVGTDSHTPMVNGVGVFGWGVGGIEAEAAMLGQPMPMVLPEVVGVEMIGALPEGCTATDLVLTVTKLLRDHPGGVVGKFVEFYGSGASSLSVTDRMTISNMAPEYGATLSFFPTDDMTLAYLKTTGRSHEHVKLVEDYNKSQGIFGIHDGKGINFSSTAKLDLCTVVPSLAGPKRPMDRVSLTDLKLDFITALESARGPKGFGLTNAEKAFSTNVDGLDIKHGQLAIAAITSCTNTSNPAVLLAAGLLAKKAVSLGLRTPEYVKTSLAPGSRVVTKYLEAAGLQTSLDILGFHTVGYGCTTCMGNTGEVDPRMQVASDEGIITGAALSGNRNFEGRVHLSVKANYICSPPLVVALGLAGRIDIDFKTEPIGQGDNGPVFLRDIWPTPQEIDVAVTTHVQPRMFKEIYKNNAKTDNVNWDAIVPSPSQTFKWDESSTYIVRPPFLDRTQEPIGESYCLLLLGDSVTTDHISPVSTIKPGQPAFKYLESKGVKPRDMSSFGARRGNADVMTRGTFGNPRVSNNLIDMEGPYTLHHPTGEIMDIFDVAERYKRDGQDLVVVAGKEYGTGSSRDWAAKGTALLGIRAIIAESFERIHRANLVGMGVLPLVFDGASKYGLTGEEKYKLQMPKVMQAGGRVQVTATSPDGKSVTFDTTMRLDTEMEVKYYQHGGVLPYVLSQMEESKRADDGSTAMEVHKGLMGKSVDKGLVGKCVGPVEGLVEQASSEVAQGETDMGAVHDGIKDGERRQAIRV